MEVATTLLLAVGDKMIGNSNRKHNARLNQRPECNIVSKANCFDFSISFFLILTTEMKLSYISLKQLYVIFSVFLKMDFTCHVSK